MLVRYFLDSDLVVEERRGPVAPQVGCSAVVVPLDATLEVAPESRAFVGQDGSACVEFAYAEPAFVRLPSSVRVTHVRRLVRVVGDPAMFWATQRLVDGEHSYESVLQSFPARQRPHARELIEHLVGAGSLRLDKPSRRAPHVRTKPGSFLAGGLSDEEVLRLVTDGGYRSYPGSPRLALEEPVPATLVPLNDIVRARRSTRSFSSAPVNRVQLAALLKVGCGITGAVEWEGSAPVGLRAYPSGGALYAVEVYVVAFSVTGLSSGLYHYLAQGPALERVRGEDVCALVRDAALPSEREMLADVAAMVCLTGHFTRHEQKYGAGGYRMLAAEAGHISQNLLLCATALGLSARPFGGLFDDLLNRACRFEDGVEEFLLAVLLGHAEESRQRDDAE